MVGTVIFIGYAYERRSGASEIMKEISITIRCHIVSEYDM